MEQTFRYKLDNSSKKFACPNCNKTRFVRYRDSETGEYLTEDFGRCDRQGNCGYHNSPPKGKKCHNVDFLSVRSITEKAYRLTDLNGVIEIVPKSQVLELGQKECWITEWFLRQGKISYSEANPKFFTDGSTAIVNTAKTVNATENKPCFHPIELVDDMYCESPTADNLTGFLKSRFTTEQVNRAAIDYLLTGTNHYWKNSTVFWQIDEKEQVHGGKIMLYDARNGKRVKNPYPHINWIHNMAKAEDFNLNQCLFGLHLINEDYQKTVCITESEKTAIIMSIFHPEHIWLATGSKQNLKHELLKPLKVRDVVLFPDKGEMEDWKARASEIGNSVKSISVSSLVEKKECPKGTDIADIYLNKKNKIEWVKKLNSRR